MAKTKHRVLSLLLSLAMVLTLLPANALAGEEEGQTGQPVEVLASELYALLGGGDGEEEWYEAKLSEVLDALEADEVYLELEDGTTVTDGEAVICVASAEISLVTYEEIKQQENVPVGAPTLPEEPGVGDMAGTSQSAQDGSQNDNIQADGKDSIQNDDGDDEEEDDAQNGGSVGTPAPTTLSAAKVFNDPAPKTEKVLVPATLYAVYPAANGIQSYGHDYNNGNKWSWDDDDDKPRFGWKMAKIQETNNGYKAVKDSEQLDLKDKVTVKITGGDNITHQTGRADISDAKESGITITPSDGYYVRAVIICCDDDDGYGCQTARRGNVYHMINADVTTGAVVIDAETLNSQNMGFHKGAGYPNWVMVELAECPSPVYAQYNFGALSGVSGLSVNIAEADQFNATTAKYQYTQGSESIPTHTVLPLLYNEAELSESTTVLYNGTYYKFTGWKAQYYTTASDGNNNVTLSAPQSNETDVTIGTDVSLHLHVKFTAQWDEIPAPTYNGTDVTVQVYVDGSAVTDPYTYVALDRNLSPSRYNGQENMGKS